MTRITPTTVLVYDGDCAFCSTSARFAARRVRGAAELVAWQRADLGALGLTPQQCSEALQWVDGGRHAAGAAAVAAYLRTAGPLWRALGAVLGSRPGLLLADPVYAVVARNRHRLPGGTPACRLDS